MTGVTARDLAVDALALRGFDVGDPWQRLRLRARLYVAFAAVSLPIALAAVTMSLVTGGRPSPALLGTVGLILVTAAVPLRRGPRTGEWTILVITSAAHVNAVSMTHDMTGTADVSRTGMALAISSVFAAVYMERTWAMAAQVAVAFTALGIVAVMSTEPDIVNAVIAAALLLLCIQIPLRLLRELALRAVAQAQRNAVTDQLTGLGNRRGLELFVEQRWSDWARRGDRVAVLLIDVDHFKEVNDTRGHASGDDVLRTLGAVLAAGVRTSDVAVRLGGEEFLLLLGNVTGDVVPVAERIRRAVGASSAGVTVSIGLHEVRPVPGDVLPEAMWAAVAIADKALYEAKRNGRNQVVRSLPGRGQAVPEQPGRSTGAPRPAADRA